MAKILLASVSEEENYILRKRFEALRDDLGKMTFLSTRPQAILPVMDEEVNLVVMNVANYSTEQRQTVLWLRESGYEGPLIVMAKNDVSAIMRELQAMKATVFVEKPYEARDLQGIVLKMFRARTVAQRIYRRFYTTQKAEIEFVESRTKTESTLYNLSKGGAYLELHGGDRVAIGDALKLHVDLSQVQKSYAMPARVVWITPNGAGGGFGVGIEFTGPGDVNKQILGNWE